MEQSCWNACLLCCSLHPGDLFPFTRKPLFIIVDSSNSTAYKVWSNQELEHKSNSLAVDYFHMLIMTHHYQVPSQLSHMMDACQIRWKTDETMIKPMMCAHIHVYTYHTCVICLWYPCDTPVMQDCDRLDDMFYGAAEHCSHCQHPCDSVVWQNFTNLFGQPLVCLLSPTTYPKGVQGKCQELPFLLVRNCSSSKVLC